MTDRVEINPDNTNKPLEQSQEDLAKQGINVNESQVNANGESINISEPDNKVQSSEDEARPNWLPEKFASAEELAKAYGELEKKMSAPKEEVPESAEEAPEEVQQLDKYYEEYTENNELSDKSYTELESMGLSRDLVDGYIAGQALHTCALMPNSTAHAGRNHWKPSPTMQRTSGQISSPSQGSMCSAAQGQSFMIHYLRIAYVVTYSKSAHQPTCQDQFLLPGR